MEAGNSVSIGGVVLLILGVLAFIASGVFYFVLMARDSNPEGTRFDAPTASNAWAPATGEAPADPYAAQPPRTATSRCDQSGGCGTGRAVHGTSDSGRFVHSSGTAV